MSSIGTIWSYPYNPRAFKQEALIQHLSLLRCLYSEKVVAAAAVNGLTVDYAPNFVMGKTNKTPEFLTDFPMGRVPTFKSADGGLTLFESDAIAQYAAEIGPASAQLLGINMEERAIIRQWIGFADHELLEPLTTLVLWRYGMADFVEKAEQAAFSRLHVSLATLEQHLHGRRYIASEQLSLADISVAAGLYWGFAQVIDRELRAKYSKTTEWYLRVIRDKRLASSIKEELIEIRKPSPAQ
ncbi:glutathione S-transferase-like protein FUS3 [Colletotrichum liriopes]|uniref:Glutathione S-transferase-like protein FUS3 n=1 Tax=Colletotrichum liriopes TaxID=708192 RepID=A0AA37GTZ3_9PEZI|nr:glutathione S-transferase-like protein FUS3 [Colletotrichum liriopes]